MDMQPMCEIAGSLFARVIKTEEDMMRHMHLFTIAIYLTFVVCALSNLKPAIIIIFATADITWGLFFMIPLAGHILKQKQLHDNLTICFTTAMACNLAVATVVIITAIEPSTEGKMLMAMMSVVTGLVGLSFSYLATGEAKKWKVERILSSESDYYNLDTTNVTAPV